MLKSLPLDRFPGANPLIRDYATDFARVRVGEKITPPDVSPDLRSMPTPALALLHHPKAQGEMVWRVGLIWAALNMVLAGLSRSALLPVPWTS